MKKLLKIALISVLSATMVALPILNVNAAIDSNGCYVPSENVESTRRYYFATPKNWSNEYSNTPAVFWWTGSDSCEQNDIQYPGYIPLSGDYEDVYYVDCPTDVEVFVWNNNYPEPEQNNYDKYEEYLYNQKQTPNVNTQFYSEQEDLALYNADFFNEMKESYCSDKKTLGEFADNFFYDEDEVFSFNFDNMIYVVGGSPVDTGKYNYMLYFGEWYFYYGNGEYGTYPLKEDAISKGIYGKLYETGGSFSADLDGDGYTNVRDITYLQRYCADFYSDYQMKVEVLADLNNDNWVDINDVTTMQRYLAGM